MKTRKESLLWELKKKGEEKCSYLFGTMHVRDERVFKYINILKSKISSCDHYAAEFDLNDLNIDHHMSMMEFEDGAQLQELIPEKKYKKLQRILQKAFHLDISLFNRLRPVFIANLIAEAILSKDRRMALDSYLWEWADGQNKKMVGIESYEEQLSILKAIPIEYQLKSLLEIGRNVSRYRRQILKLTYYYENSELNKLYKAGKNSLGKMKRLLLYSRNYHMADRIALLASTGSVFCSIGAGHLSGQKGVLTLLKSKGYSLKPVFLV